MVNDLEASLDAMIDHELIAAIAGDKAQAALRERQAKVDATDPNYVPLADEFLVLDTDASQNYVINAVLGGQDLIVRGPPGTGRTIANLIATLLARRKKVLFVAEKRAAIDAVLKRLEQRGLDDLACSIFTAAPVPGGSSPKVWRERSMAIAASRVPTTRPTNNSSRTAVSG